MRTSSGRTAGTVWCSTRSSELSVGCQRGDGAPAVELAQPLLGHPLDEHRVGGEEGGRSRRRARRASASVSRRHRLAVSRSASEPPGDSATATTSRPSGITASRASRTAVGVEPLGEPDLEVLRLAGRPGRRGAGVRDARVGVEARGVGHREPGPDQGALEGAREVTVGGEPEPATLGVADPEPLDRRGLLLGLLTHPDRVGPCPACARSRGSGGREDAGGSRGWSADLRVEQAVRRAAAGVAHDAGRRAADDRAAHGDGLAPGWPCR